MDFTAFVVLSIAPFPETCFLAVNCCHCFLGQDLSVYMGGGFTDSHTHSCAACQLFCISWCGISVIKMQTQTVRIS